jgi:transcriptional antiterminator RfaH
MSTKNWYLVYAKPRQETVAQENLRRQGYATYLPLIRQRRKRRGRHAHSIGPMFPRYLFIHLDSGGEDNWGPIRSTVGVASLVRFGREAALVPDALVAALRQREDEQGIQIVPDHEFRTGSRVRITDGSLAGYEGVLLARSGRDRVVLLLDILGKHTRAVVDTAAIEPGD